MSDYDPDAVDAFEAAGWGTKDPGAYDALAGRVTSRVADSLLDAVDAGPGRRVLDVTIRAHFDEALDVYRATAGFDVPVSVKVGSGSKPR